MIVFRDKKIIIVTPPHTASGSLHRTLCNSNFCGEWVYGVSPDGYSDHHSVTVPPVWNNFKKLLVVRNPYDRLIGLYLHYLWSCKNCSENLVKLNLSWEEFIEAVTLDDSLSLSWFFRWTITRCVEKQPLFDLIIRYENIEEELSSLLSTPVKLESRYHDKNVFDDYYYSIKTKEYVKAWALPDCVRYNYSQEI